MERITIYTWNENCTLKGRVVSQNEVERRTDGDGNVSDGDWHAWTGTREEILRDARYVASVNNGFHGRCARAVIDQLS